MCNTCNTCQQCTQYCTCQSKPVYNPCGPNQACVEKVDAACVVYRQHAPTSLSRLKNLTLPSLTTLEQFMEAVDHQLGMLLGPSTETAGLSGLDLTWLRQKYLIKSPADLYKALQDELKTLGQTAASLDKWIKSQVKQITENAQGQEHPALVHPELAIDLTDTVHQVLGKLLTPLAHTIRDVQTITDRVKTLENHKPTITIPLSQLATNRLRLLEDGLYVPPVTPEQVVQTEITVDNRGRSVKLMGEGENRHTLSAELLIADQPTGLVKTPAGSVTIDPEKLLDFILASPADSTLRTKFKLIVSQ